jgi:hypothetical protein
MRNMNVDRSFFVARFIIAVATTKTALRYFSLFLMVGGMFGSYNVALAWISSTFARPRAKRAAAYAIINSLGNGKSRDTRMPIEPLLKYLPSRSRPSLVSVPIRQEVLPAIPSRIRHEHRHGRRCRSLLPRFAILPRARKQEDGRARRCGSGGRGK